MRIHCAEALESETICLARGDRLSVRVIWSSRRRKIRRRRQGSARVRFPRIGWHVDRLADFLQRDRQLVLREGLTVPVFLAGGKTDPVTLDGARENRLRLALRGLSSIESRE